MNADDDPAFSALVAAVERFLGTGGRAPEANTATLLAAAQGRPYAPLRRATVIALRRIQQKRAKAVLDPLASEPQAPAPSPALH
jgi:hypothetical protein